MDAFQRLMKSGSAPEVLRHARQYKIRASAEVVEFGRDLVVKGADWLGDEAWQVYEQVFIAALDVNDQQLADVALKHLQKKFTDSSRVDRLVAMKAESLGQYTEASTMYLELLDKNPLNALVMKRLVAIAKAQGYVGEAITRLNAYLKQFQGDTTAWQELADLYLEAGDVSSAVFCLEELVLCSPTNFVFHCKLASAYYTLGGADNLRLARKHYAQALEVHGDGNLRALYGLCQTCYALATTGNRKDKVSDGRVNLALFQLGSDRMKEHYEKNNPKLLPQVERSLSVQEVAVREAS